MISLRDLHDATFRGLEVDWPNGELRCNFDVSIGKTTSVRLVAHGLKSLKCPRQLPWGRSISVNKAHVDRTELEVRLVIEMQSGDVIEADVADVILE